MAESAAVDIDAEITWWISRVAPDAGYQPWLQDDEHEARQGEARWVRVAAHNLGDPVDLAVCNLVAPLGMTVLEWDQRSGIYAPPLTGAENPTVGTEPEHRVQYFVTERKWPRRFVQVGIYLLVLTDSAGAGVTLLYDVGGVGTTRRITIG
jgi:hypothetical protein